MINANTFLHLEKIHFLYYTITFELCWCKLFCSQHHCVQLDIINSFMLPFSYSMLSLLSVVVLLLGSCRRSTIVTMSWWLRWRGRSLLPRGRRRSRGVARMRRRRLMGVTRVGSMGGVTTVGRMTVVMRHACRGCRSPVIIVWRWWRCRVGSGRWRRRSMNKCGHSRRRRWWRNGTNANGDPNGRVLGVGRRCRINSRRRRDHLGSVADYSKERKNKFALMTDIDSIF